MSLIGDAKEGAKGPGVDLKNFMTVAHRAWFFVGVVKPKTSATVCCGAGKDSQTKLHMLRT